MKLWLGTGVLVLVAVFIGFSGYSLSVEGERERARMKWEHSDPGPLDFMIWRDEEGGLEWCAAACFDPPTGSFVFFRVPTSSVGFGLMGSALVLVSLGGFRVWRGPAATPR